MADSDAPAPIDPAATVDAASTPAPARGGKAPTAFRTISEVAADLDVPQHVLRFWESKFPQIRPLKRGGGRRYYRPDDVALLIRIRALLYAEGYTIKGVQRLLQEGGRSPAVRAAAKAGDATLPRMPLTGAAPLEGGLPAVDPSVSTVPVPGPASSGLSPDGASSIGLAPDQRRALAHILDDLREIRAAVAALA